MAKYNVTFKKSVAKDLRSIPNKDITRILSRIDELAIDPRGEGCIKLSGLDCYRVRQGLYRIIYQIIEDRLVVNVVKVTHRSGVYQSK
ncbi:type II toxin-antitoxin system RelE/ParE family toxin [Paraglaciecola sp.]|uniref:type II toxin-antitoxin system RelE family toxin n=1 Tax=Paraglaciecola sp. TaxID=1920173 RepID=UPI0030F4998B